MAAPAAARSPRCSGPDRAGRVLTIAGFAAILVGEVSSLAQQLPEYRSNLESKIRSLPSVTPGGGVFGRAAHMLQELSNELWNSTNEKAAPSAVASAAPAPAAVATKPVSVQIQEPEPGPLQIVQDISSGRCCNPLASAGLVVVFVVMILLDREDLRDRLLRLAGRGDLHRTTVAMNDAAERISRIAVPAHCQPQLRCADRARAGADRHPQCRSLRRAGSTAAVHLLSRDRHCRRIPARPRDRHRAGLDVAGLDRPAFCRDRDDRFQHR
jgi:hypothetical protein